MITTNLTLTNGVTSETPVVVTGITFEAGTKLAVNPATTFPFTMAIDSSVVVGIDFDETINTGNSIEEITINTLGNRYDIVHTVNIVDTTHVCDDGYITNGCFDDVNLDDWIISGDGEVVGGRLELTNTDSYPAIEQSFALVAGTYGLKYMIEETDDSWYAYVRKSDATEIYRVDMSTDHSEDTTFILDVDDTVKVKFVLVTEVIGDKLYLDNVSVNGEGKRLASSEGNLLASNTGNYLVSID